MGRIPLVVTVVCMAGALSACTSSTPEREVAMPAPDAGPLEVVRAYVDALDANDEETASRLITSEHHELSWIGSVEAVTDLKAWEPVREDPRWSGHPRTAEVVRVPVRLDVTWSDPDPSVEDGQQMWSYLLIRDEGSGRWLIFDEGMG